MSKSLQFTLLVLGLLVFRTAFGLSQPFFSPDELQTYLIGLHTYCTGNWPYFGPDLIVTETGFYSQIPGALEGLLIALPLKLCPIPEAPTILLNLLAIGGITFFCFYLSKRIPSLPPLFLLAWVALLPWNLHETANTNNACYLVIGSTLFFLGWMEIQPSLSIRWLSPAWAWALMGFGTFWNLQFHSSWVLFPPLMLLAAYASWKAGKLKVPQAVLSTFLGALVPLSFLLPTLILYGFQSGAPGLGLFTSFNFQNFTAIYLILPRFFSFATFEVQRFLLFQGMEHHSDFFRLHPFLILPGFFLILVGWAQAASLILAPLWAKEKKDRPILRWTWITVGLLWASFWLTSKEPLAHIYFILWPLVAAYSLHLWAPLYAKRGWRIFTWTCLAANLWFQTGYMAHAFKAGSLYIDREKVVKAIETKDYHLLGERRPGSHN